MRRVPPEMFKEFLGSPLLTTGQVASALSIPIGTLKEWRNRRRRAGPTFIRVGRAVRYDVADLARYLRKRRVRARS
jgi:hypothetical protein